MPPRFRTLTALPAPDAPSVRSAGRSAPPSSAKQPSTGANCCTIPLHEMIAQPPSTAAPLTLLGSRRSRPSLTAECRSLTKQPRSRRAADACPCESPYRTNPVTPAPPHRASGIAPVAGSGAREAACRCSTLPTQCIFSAERGRDASARAPAAREAVLYGVSTIFPRNPPRSNRAYASRKRSRGRISATRTVNSPAAARRANTPAASASGWTCTV